MENYENEFEGIFLARASFGKRLLNYIIDFICFYIAFLALMILYSLIDPEIFDTLSNIDNIIDRLITSVGFGIFAGVFEGLMKGRTPGKYLTGTLTVFDSGERIDFMTGFKRGMIKAVPFVAFSALSSEPYPWQDRWTDTYVIDIKKTRANSESRDIQEIGMKSDVTEEPLSY